MNCSHHRIRLHRSVRRKFHLWWCQSFPSRANWSSRRRAVPLWECSVYQSYLHFCYSLRTEDSSEEICKNLAFDCRLLLDYWSLVWNCFVVGFDVVRRGWRTLGRRSGIVRQALWSGQCGHLWRLLQVPGSAARDRAVARPLLVWFLMIPHWGPLCHLKQNSICMGMCNKDICS